MGVLLIRHKEGVVGSIFPLTTRAAFWLADGSARTRAYSKLVRCAPLPLADSPLLRSVDTHTRSSSLSYTVRTSDVARLYVILQWVYARIRGVTCLLPHLE